MEIEEFRSSRGSSPKGPPRGRALGRLPLDDRGRTARGSAGAWGLHSEAMDAERYQAIKRVFGEALEKPEAQWSAFLESASGGDADLAREVRELLVAHGGGPTRSADVLADLVPAAGTPGGESSLSRSTSSSPVPRTASAPPRDLDPSRRASIPRVGGGRARVLAALGVAGVLAWAATGFDAGDPEAAGEDPEQRSARLEALAHLSDAHAALLGGMASDALAHLAEVPIDQRDWGWGYLRTRATMSLDPGTKSAPGSGRTIDLVHPADVVDLGFDAAHRPLTLDARGVLRGWSEDGQERIRSTLPSAPSPFAISNSGEGLVRIGWMELLALDPLDHRLLTRREFETWIHDVAISSDGKLAALRVPEGVHVVEVPSLTSIYLSEVEAGVEGPGEVLALSTDGRWLATQGAAESPGPGTSIYLWDLTELELARRIPTPAVRIAALDFAPDGERLVAGLEDGRVMGWSLEEGARLFEIDAHRGSVRALAWTSRGLRVVSGGLDGRLCLWDTTDGSAVFELEESSDPVEALSFTSEGRRLAATVGRRTVRVFEGLRPENMAESSSSGTRRR